MTQPEGDVSISSCLCIGVTGITIGELHVWAVGSGTADRLLLGSGPLLVPVGPVGVFRQDVLLEPQRKARESRHKVVPVPAMLQ